MLSLVRSMKDKTQAWTKFTETGAVGAYLMYCAMRTNKKKPGPES